MFKFLLIFMLIMSQSCVKVTKITAPSDQKKTLDLIDSLENKVFNIKAVAKISLPFHDDLSVNFIAQQNKFVFNFIDPIFLTNIAYFFYNGISLEVINFGAEIDIASLNIPYNLLAIILQNKSGFKNAKDISLFKKGETVVAKWQWQNLKAIQKFNLQNHALIYSKYEKMGSEGSIEVFFEKFISIKGTFFPKQMVFIVREGLKKARIILELENVVLNEDAFQDELFLAPSSLF